MKIDDFIMNSMLDFSMKIEFSSFSSEPQIIIHRIGAANESLGHAICMECDLRV